MQFKSLLLAAAALASVSAKVILTDVTFAGITVGTPFNISWADAEGPVTLTLQNGPSTNLKDVATIGSGLASPSGSFLWTPSSSLAADTYVVKISDGTTTNYGALFQLLGATASASSSASSASASGSTSLSASVTSSGNSTVTSTASSTVSSSTGSSKTGSKTSSSSPSKTSSGAASSSTTSAPGGNSASGLASPLAMILLALAAVLSFN